MYIQRVGKRSSRETQENMHAASTTSAMDDLPS
jgi:hypothetical protein